MNALGTIAFACEPQLLLDIGRYTLGMSELFMSSIVQLTAVLNQAEGCHTQAWCHVSWIKSDGDDMTSFQPECSHELHACHQVPLPHTESSHMIKAMASMTHAQGPPCRWRPQCCPGDSVDHAIRWRCQRQPQPHPQANDAGRVHRLLPGRLLLPGCRLHRVCGWLGLLQCSPACAICSCDSL